MPNKKTFSRVDRIRKAISREFDDILRNDIKDPAFVNQLISVTDVTVTNDLRYTTIYLSIMGEESKQKQLIDLLTEYTPKIRYGLGKRIQLRHTPEVIIKQDTSLERGARMLELLNQIATADTEQEEKSSEKILQEDLAEEDFQEERE
ncbi:MAG: 30S ribosome-binding factor RbfA [Cyanobacteria bacterium P01_H01_bin.74]